ncbi:sulfurtransferase-like selenium metabolism protein YedF [Heyndrickxia acidiproducens]|uniref:sulfurtransferase-like selenium metabolism protein YedF n=1 Tax=Heyndrickxia acidiproducens TaxID=1121084 RepID=UPI00035E8472|nr:sulfurtransferase-like selenium metabolism protein YedF [Heyndrickxia acidiproducens]
MAEKKKQLMVDATLDVRGESCPYPELYTLEAIEKLEDGKILEVIADCPQSFINVPASCKRHGHQVLSTVKDGTTLYYYIQVCK